ncbi:hypothetical protein [Clostridium thailandense]|uniref:Uncharacterized protein n=1 Tax=Clostridium thailandense TaxID=2794346 RepID=A0A949X582_9CLOT|nr:hypothetical protein [Clostridium thailandense]MBV7275223.1 hypothetical protein [Clostridium thailandense]MCH5137734.1 hypothetical protein [Clostridiaceae bacterium UIB06]
MNKKSKLITPDVIEECLCESLDIIEKSTLILEKNSSSHRKTKISSK